MPANLPPHYYELEREFKDERDPVEKLRLAKELLALMPKHKGTDKLQADLKAKISKLKRQVEGGAKKKHGARQIMSPDHIEREGARLIILIGPPNSGKSSLLDSLTNSRPLIGDYPYTTREPMTGMMNYHTVQFQLIDTPPISEEQMEKYMPNLVRQADLLVMVADVCNPGFEERTKAVFDRLEEKRIVLVPEIPKEKPDPLLTYKKMVFAAHKYLDENGDVGFKKLHEQYPDYKIIPSSILDNDIMENFKTELFNSLDIIRVFTKPVGKEADFTDPIILARGSTVDSAAKEIHRDFARKLQYARVWGHGKFEGQRVKNSFVLSDGDIIEFRI
jgi:small GTP-binding protein